MSDIVDKYRNEEIKVIRKAILRIDKLDNLESQLDYKKFMKPEEIKSWLQRKTLYGSEIYNYMLMADLIDKCNEYINNDKEHKEDDTEPTN